MRHGKKFNHLSRKTAHRKAMLANMACSLIEHKRVNTTVAKAKALQKYVEPLITKSKTDSTHSRRVVFSYLKSKDAVTELFRDVSAKVADRPGGYTRILKTGFRMGDNAEMCFIELVDYNENMLKETKAKKSRRRRGGAKKTETTAAAPVAEETVEEVADEATLEAETKAEVVEEAPVAEEAKAEETEAKAEEAAPEAPAEEPAAEEKKEEAPAKEETPKAEAKEDTPEAKDEEKKGR